MWWNKKLFLSLKFIDGESSPYGNKVIIRHYNYSSYLTLGPGIVVIRIIPCSCQACTKILSLSWYLKIKEEFNRPRYGRVYNCKYSQIIGCCNNCIIIKNIYGTDEEYCKQINRTIIYDNLMNTYLTIMEGNCGAINAEYSLCHGYYILKFTSYPYILQSDLIIDGQVISVSRGLINLMLIVELYRIY